VEQGSGTLLILDAIQLPDPGLHGQIFFFGKISLSIVGNLRAVTVSTAEALESVFVIALFGPRHAVAT
jgi:hypothetical protein